MIRRQIQDSFYLFTQHDHALLAGEIARHIGNKLFERPEPHEAFVLGVAEHDSGWPIHDDQPTLNRAGQPLDVFEIQTQSALPLWEAAADRASAKSEHAGLLVSLHVLSLSLSSASTAAEKADPRLRFDINRFQHRQIELQERLRPRLSMRNDIPLHHGLAEDSAEPAELQLVHQFRLLQAMDQLSLNMLCTTAPFQAVRPVFARPGGKSLTLKTRRVGEWTTHVTPWPFDADRIDVPIRARRIAAGQFSSIEEFRTAYSAAATQLIDLQILPD